MSEVVALVALVVGVGGLVWAEVCRRREQKAEQLCLYLSLELRRVQGELQQTQDETYAIKQDLREMQKDASVSYNAAGSQPASHNEPAEDTVVVIGADGAPRRMPLTDLISLY